MANNCHIISFQELKKFFNKQKYEKTKVSFTKISEDSRLFGSAYHKILEQECEIIAYLAKKPSIRELDKIIKNYSLSILEKEALLKMIKNIHHNRHYQKYIANPKYIHREQSFCHFINKNQYVFRLETIIDALISVNKNSKIIVDYKTINSIGMIGKQISENHYWMQLLFYKKVYEGAISNGQVVDLYLFFQSKDKNDNFEIQLHKFSNLPRGLRTKYELELHDGLNGYIDYVCKYKKSSEGFKIPNTVNLEKHSMTHLWRKIKAVFKFITRVGIIGLISFALWLFYNSEFYVFNETISYCGVGIFAIWSIWFICNA